MSTIYAEEDEVIVLHRQQVDDVMNLIKQEMRLLAEVEQPGADIDAYVTELDEILAQKQTVVTSLRQRLAEFRARLQEEEMLSRSIPRSPQ